MISFSMLVLLALSPCDDATRLAEQVGEESITTQQAVEQLDPSLSALKPFVLAAEGRYDEGVNVGDGFANILTTHCASLCAGTGAGEYGAQVKAILEQNNITSVREWNPLQRLAYIVGAWIESFFEKEGVQKYANQISRIFFVIAFAVVVVLVGFQLWRRRGRKVKVEKEIARREQKRLLKFSAWRKKATAALAQGDVRESLRLGQMALLIRLGELAPNVVDDTRTHDEIIAALPKTLTHLAPWLREVRDVFFGGGESKEYAEGFLHKVDALADTGFREVSPSETKAAS